MSIKPTTRTFQYGKHTVTLNTGNIARQATAAVMVDMDGTTVLVTVVGAKDCDPDKDFFPLTVNYQERSYAGGKIPGGFFKREGRPTEREILTSRLIDRPLRPLFPEGFTNEVQVIATVMSVNPEILPDIPAMLGASAALVISGMPFNGPMAAARVGYLNDEYVLNPTHEELETSKLDLVVAGTADSVLMVESEAKELSENVMLGAVNYGHDAISQAVQEIIAFADEAGGEKWDWQPQPKNDELKNKIAAFIESDLKDAYKLTEKVARYAKIKELKEKVLAEFVSDEQNGADNNNDKEVLTEFSNLEKNIVRSRVLAGEKRIDGRDLTTVRPIAVNVGVLPRAHGSALFTRGETQAIVVTTLGTARDAMLVEHPKADYRESFMLHYNFPPYCVGETGMVGSPKRREIGHGNLAKRALVNVLPSQEDFPYVTRIVSEITESNGSSSMATVCGGSLSLMDAGVNVKAPVAGIAMGLVKDGDNYAVLTDILGDEDHLGDMDFKVAGTKDGVTALQMDIKISGITSDIMDKALKQALDARIHILNIMATALDKPKQEMSRYAPRITTFYVEPDKVRTIIGKGGATIKALTEETGVVIELEDDGKVMLTSADEDASNAARKQIELLVKDAEVGEIYEGDVTKIVDFGAFVKILPGKEGLLHISQISNERVENVEDHIQMGQTVKVKVLEIDRQGRIRLGMKNIEQDTQNVDQ